MTEWQRNFFIENWSSCFWKRNLNQALLHFEGNRDVLFVGFDSEHGNNKSKNWRPWGAEFATENELSYLGFSTVEPDWYLSEWFDEQVARLKEEGFFDGYSRIVFAGHSMGAYAAMRFSTLVEGAHVAAFSPQISLQTARSSFDKRFEQAARLPWRGDATDVSKMTFDPDRCWVFYDPYVPEDRAHAEHLIPAGAQLLRTYYAGHGSMAFLRKIGVGDDVLRAICFETLTPFQYYQLFRFRRYTPWFHKAVQNYFASKGRDEMVKRLGNAVARLKAGELESRFAPEAKAIP